MGLDYSYSQPSEDEDLFGNSVDSGYSETDELIRRDKADSPVQYPPQPEVEFGFLQICYCGAQPLVATSNSRNDPGRRYYNCANVDDGECHVWKWWDVTVMEEMRARDRHVLQLAEKVENLTLFSDHETEQKLLSLEKIVCDIAKEKSYFSNGTKRAKKRIFIMRNREEGHKKLWNDYFSDTPTFPRSLFWLRFRMNKTLFLRIVHRMSTEVEYFQPREDAARRSSLSPLQKCTATIRQLAYGGGADIVDEYVQLSETTAQKCLHHFTAGIIHLYGDEYLRRPTPEDLQRLLYIGEQRGFPGMVGSIDCTMNNLNILDRSSVFDDIINGIAPQATFIRSIRLPQGPKNSLFPNTQEAVRKDVERAFGVLQARFAVVKNPSNLWDKDKIANIMRACIILHNMIVEDERSSFTQYDVDEFQEREVVDTFSVTMPSTLGTTIDRRTSVRNRQDHQHLKNDLIENI
uniref:GRF-type domain-containing protein n=1 Tax=Brassica oleracea var. oleracea TaxID=109376 RepID=A0A0D3CBN1_BRAOL